MKTALISTLAIAAAFAVASAAQAAPVTGTTTITGSVAAKCAVGAGFDASENLSELSDPAGTLRTTLSGTTAASPAFTKTFTLTCTAANAGVSVTSSPLANVTAAPAGFSNSIAYTGRASFDLVNPAPSTSTLDVDDPTSGGATTTAFGSANYLANASNNVRVKAYGFSTAAPTDLLVAGSYTGTIVVVITP